MSAVANGNANGKTGTKGFSVEFLPAPESQEPLGIGDDSNLEAPPLDPPPADRLGAGPSTTVEEWKLAPGVTNLRVSTRGRVQRKDSRGGGWGYMHTPAANAGDVYATVTYKGEPVVVHRLVWMTFVGPIPDGMTIDHMIPSRKFDNRLSALRLATQSEQNGNQGPETDLRAPQFHEDGRPRPAGKRRRRQVDNVRVGTRCTSGCCTRASRTRNFTTPTSVGARVPPRRERNARVGTGGCLSTFEQESSCVLYREVYTAITYIWI